MIILSIRTDRPEAEIGLFDDQKRLAYEVWHAHRELSTTIHRRIARLLSEQGKRLCDLEGVICYRGPGSFTGLRIGLSVANALSYALQIPLAGTQTETWQHDAFARLLEHGDTGMVLPEYGMPAHTTLPKH